MKITHYIVIAALFVTAGRGVGAELSDTRIREGEVQQTQLREKAEKLSAYISTMIAEYERNGVGGPDVRVLKAVSGTLDKLTEKEMEEVIALLQRARTDENGSARDVAAAYGKQKDIVADLQRLVAQYEKNQATNELVGSIDALAARQQANLRVGSELLQWLEKKGGKVKVAKKDRKAAAADMEEAGSASLEAQHSEQNAITDETALVLQKALEVARQAGPEQERFARLVQLATRLQVGVSLQAATAALADTDLDAAVEQEEIAYKALAALAGALAPPKEASEVLKQALDDVQRAVVEQKQLLATTGKMTEKDKKKRPDLDALAQTQADLGARVAQVRQDIAGEKTPAGASLTDALNAMREAHASITAKNQGAAIAAEKETVAKLESARKDLEGELAKSLAESGQTPAGLTAADRNKELKAEAQDLLDKQIAAIKSAATPGKSPAELVDDDAVKQSQLARDTADLAAKAGAEASNSEKPLQQATAAMTQATRLLATPDSQPIAQVAQNTAVNALKDAVKQIAQDGAAIAQKEQQLAAEIALREKVSAILARQQGLDVETGKLAGLKKAGTGDVAPQVEALAPRQAAVGTETRAAQAEVPATVTDAKTALATAETQMEAARTQLAAAKASESQPAQELAIGALMKALLALDQSVSKLQAELGVPATATDVAQVQDALTKAQDQLADAQDQLNQAADAQSGAPAGAEPSAPADAQAGQPTSPAASDPSAPSAPTASEPSTPSAPTASEPSTPSAPTASTPSTPSSPTASEPGAPSAPTASTPSTPSSPTASTPSSPSSPTASIPSSPSSSSPSSPSSTQQAAQPLQDAAAATAAAAAAAGADLPADASAALATANSAMADATAQAAANDTAGAQASAAAAQAALAQAQSALSQAAAGITPAAPGAPGAPGAPSTPGMAGAPGMPGAPSTAMTPGNPTGPDSSAGPSDGPSSGTESLNVSTGSRAVAEGSTFIGLPARDRAAIEQSRAEQYPEEYGQYVEGYFQSLADSPRE